MPCYEHLPGFSADPPTEQGYYWAVRRGRAHKIGELSIFEVVGVDYYADLKVVHGGPGLEVEEMDAYIWGPRVDLPEAPLTWLLDFHGGL